METKIKISEAEFHAVDFMRNVRLKLSKKYLEDEALYKKDLKKAMENFKKKQKKIYGTQ